jgi:hypothetical protein
MTLLAVWMIAWPAVRHGAQAQSPPPGGGQAQPVPPPAVPNDQSISGVNSPYRVAADQEERARKQQTPQPRARAVYFIWNSISPAEFEALGRRTLFLFAIWTQRPEELPVKRIYIRADNQDQEIYKLSSWRTPVDPGLLTAKVYGTNREDSFYLVPGAAMLRQGQIVLDLANRTGWDMMDLPSNVASDNAKRFRNLDPPPNPKPNLKILQAIIQQKFTGFPAPQSLP